MRVGVWQGRLEGVHEIFYQFRVQSRRRRSMPLPEGPVARAARGHRQELRAGEPRVPGERPRGARHPRPPRAAGGRERARPRAQGVRLRDPRGRDRRERGLRRAAHPRAARGERDRARRASSSRMLRGAGVPARIVRGLELRELAAPDERVWCEAWLGSALDPALARRRLLRGAAREPRAPRRRRPRARGGDGAPRPSATASARSASACDPKRSRCSWSPTARSSPRLSLYQLPVGTQSALRALLLFPLGALIVALFRNVVGVPDLRHLHAAPRRVRAARLSRSRRASPWSPSCSRSASARASPSSGCGC